MQLSHLDRCPLLSIAAPIGEERERREERMAKACESEREM